MFNYIPLFVNQASHLLDFDSFNQSRLIQLDVALKIAYFSNQQPAIAADITLLHRFPAANRISGNIILHGFIHIRLNDINRGRLTCIPWTM